MSFVYLASPYTPKGVDCAAKRATIRESRYLAACRAASYLMRSGKVVFAPIPHSHGIDLCFDAAESGEFWKRQDEPYLELCAEMVVLMLPGWEQSTGVAHEIQRARERGIPIAYMEPL